MPLYGIKGSISIEWNARKRILCGRRRFFAFSLQGSFGTILYRNLTIQRNIWNKEIKRKYRENPQLPYPHFMREHESRSNAKFNFLSNRLCIMCVIYRPSNIYIFASTQTDSQNVRSPIQHPPTTFNALTFCTTNQYYSI